MITMIAAVSENYVLGKDNQLLWHLPNDFKRFKQLTSNHTIVMGRKTLESLPGILPNRKHVVLTRDKTYLKEGCVVIHNLEEVKKVTSENELIYIIGGGEIYHQFLPYADTIELTRVHTSVEGDAFFPKLNPEEWQLTNSAFHPKDEKHKFDFTFETYTRKQG